MSLIHEALRKARRESAEGDNLGVVYSRGLTGRRSRPGVGSGIALGVLITVAVGALIGGALWLRLSRPSQSSAPEIETAAGSRGGGSATGRTDAVSGLEPTQSAPTHDTAEPPAQPAPRRLEGRIDDQGTTPEPTIASEPDGAADGSPAAGSTPRRDVADPGGQQPTQVPAAAIRPTTESGERVFDVEANVGYATLTLDYIVFRSTEPFAQINGVDVRVGSTIEGFTVDEIGASSVRLHDTKGPLILRVP